MADLLRLSPLLMVLLAACSTGSSRTSDIGPVLPGPGSTTAQTTTLQAPAQQIATAQSLTDVSAFIDPAAYRLLSPNERTEAASAQFNALNIGRTGAPRSWQGDRGASGQILVGPPVNVNALYCRDFTHTVSAGGQTFAKKAMACREPDGRWSVVAS